MTGKDESCTSAGERKTGYVYLVGAGPGGRDLLTVKGLALLRRCDAVVYDRLSGEELLAEVKPSCELVYVGKKTGRHTVSQEEINEILIHKAREGKEVVRLKGGDPFVFGRGGEEAESLMREHIPFTVVPGVTSAVAVPALAGIPVTHRRMSRSFHVITAHTALCEDAQAEAYLREQIKRLRDAEGTLVFLMGLSSLETICGLLLAYGRPPDLPMAVVGSGTRYNETVVRGTLSDIAGRTRQRNVSSPAVIVAGRTASLSLRADEPLPLHGVRIGVTGTKALTDKLGQRFRDAGAEVLRVQELFIRPLDGQERYFGNLSAYTWIVFTSGNGVRLFWGELQRRRLDIRILHGIKIAAIGSGTAESLSRFGLYPDYMPRRYTAEELAKGLAERLERERDSVLLYQALEGNPVLEETLRAAGIKVERAEAYTTYGGEVRGREAFSTLSYVTFASASGVKAFVRENPHIFAESVMRGVRAAAIGEKTAQALAEAGCINMLTAGTYTADGLAEAVIADVCSRDGAAAIGEKTAQTADAAGMVRAAERMESR